GSCNQRTESVADRDRQRRSRGNRTEQVDQESAGSNAYTNVTAKNQDSADCNAGRGPDGRNIAAGEGYGKARSSRRVIQEQNDERLERTFPRILHVQLHGEIFETSNLESTFFLQPITWQQGI